MMYMWGVYFFLMSITFMGVSLMFYIMKFSFLFEFSLLKMNSFCMEFLLLADWISLMFISIVMIISSMIIFYSIEYMKNDQNLTRFLYLLNLFILSMFFMVLSPSVLSILLGWDGLGLISYCLVIYYQNYNSYNAGMVTILCNRLGDVGLIMWIGFMFSYGSWNFFLYNYYMYMIMIYLLMLAALTKSAQLPFSSWLPLAMAAPTPISSLVHSSTLVTAGVYIMIRYSGILLESKLNKLMLLMVSMTMFMSGLGANMEMDLKKIIALSTLSQLSLMMSSVSLGWIYLAYFHLLIHALFKSLLFMCAGMIIHLMNNNQDIRYMGGLIKLFPLLVSIFLAAKLALCGFPFLSGFYSKDLIMEIMFMNQINLFSLMLLLFSTLFTVSYTIRLYIYMMVSNLKFKSSFMFHENWHMNYSLWLNYFFSLMSGSLLMWLVYDFNELIILNLFLKIMVLMLSMMGMLLGLMFYYLHMNKMIFYMSSMWFLDFCLKYIYLIFFMVGLNFMKYMEKGWMEFYSGSGMIKFMMFKSNKLYYFIYYNLMFFMLILLFLIL